MGSSTEGTVSMVDESCEAVGGSSSKGEDAEEVHADSAEGSGKGKSRKRRREPTMEGRRWRRKPTGYGFMFDKEGRGLRGIVPVSMRERCTLEKIYKFNKTLEPYQKEVIEGTILKPILEYRPFSMQRELTVAPVKPWVLRRKASRLARRLFSVYDVALFTGLPVTGKIVEFGEDDLFTTELARMVRLHMAQYVTEKSDNLKSEKGRKRPVFRNYIKVMKKLLDANKEPKKLELWLSLYAWRVMSGLCSQEPLTELHGLCRSTWRTFAECANMHGRKRYDAFQLVEGIKESEVIPVLRPWEEEMLLPTIRAFMNTDGFRDYILDLEGVLSYEEHLQRAREELRAEKGKHVDTLRMLEFWKSRAHELEARLKRCAEPDAQPNTRHQPGGDVGVDIQSGSECLAGAVTDVAEASVHEISLGKGADKDATCETAADIPGGTVHRSPQENSSSRCRRLGSQMRRTGPMPRRRGDTAATDDSGMESLHHAPPTAANTAAADDEACVQPPVDDSGHRVITLEQAGDIKGETERTSPDADDVVHGSSFTDPTRLSGARKSKKEMKDGVTGTNEPAAMDDPAEGSVDPPILDMQPLSVEGSGIDPSVEELNKMKLTKKVLARYISAPLSATEMELVTKVRSRFKGVRLNAR
ncbi:hypothetical protein Cgig2_005632 [Carnegiea gigantea]|uniref:Uncharacterized protein n=1 Tax=Carnegiea gigantea TaxID=171969 RepID=A0A9Q1QRG6_9CARY|nr:hypothetical protein Cgig2_005632 [Carnegiea gigantea]